MTKKTKRDVVYSKGMRLAHCGICRHFEAKTRTCTKVEGPIEADKWCRLFAKRDDEK